MTRSTWSALAFPAVLATMLSTMLAACDARKEPVPAGTSADASATQAPAARTPRLLATPVHVELKAGQGCTERCNEFKATWLHFTAAPELQKALMAAVALPADVSPQQVLTQAGQRFLKESEEGGGGWQQMLSARVENGQGRISIIVVETYDYTGGAHGMSTVRYLNWDPEQGKVLTLGDMLLPGKESAFWDEAQRAHQRWLAARPTDAPLGDGWPFVKADTLALRPQGVELKYLPYSIAPYSEGMPALMLPYQRLSGILKPAYLPAAPAR